MDEAIRIDDRDNGETVIEVRETFGQFLHSSLNQTFMIVYLILTFPLLAFTLPLIVLFLFVPNLFCAINRITITPMGKGFFEISKKSYLQIAGCELLSTNQAKTYDYVTGGPIADERIKRNSASEFIITIPCVDGEEMRIYVNGYPYTLQKILNKTLIPKKSESVAKTEIREDTVLDGENDYSLSITALLSAIDPENFSTLVKDNQLVVNNKKSYDCNTFGILLGGIGYTVIGFSGIFVSSSGLDIRFNIGFLAYLVFIFSTALMFRGVHSMVKRFIAEPIYQTVRFDSTSQVITLEEEFLTYKSAQKYFWEKAELSIVKSQNAKDYLEDKKVLMLTLQKSGQPARRVELFKHENEEYLIKLRDYIMEFTDNLGQNFHI